MGRSRANSRNSDVDIFTGIPLLPLLPFTKVRNSLDCCYFFLNLGSEMYSKEDGTIPATFQVIYMVYLLLTAPGRKPDVENVDRMETISKPPKTSGEGISHEKPQGCPLSQDRGTRICGYVLRPPRLRRVD